MARSLRNSDPGPKEIAHGSAARARILEGLALTTEAIASTLGPLGRSVIIERPGKGPQITRDGHTIARSIELEDRIADLGARIVQEVAHQTDDGVGDGTTTAVVLAGTLVREGMKAVAAGCAPRDLSRGIDRATAAALAGLGRRAQPLHTKRQLAAVATLSAGGENEVGALVARALEAVGEEGFVVVEEGSGRETELDIRDGMHFEGGYLSSHFVTDRTRLFVEMEEPFVLVHDGEIASFGAIEPALRAFAKSGKRLLVVARDVVGEALATLVVNRRQGGLHVAAVRAPGAGRWRQAVLEDIAIVTGAELVGDGLGHKLEQLRPEMLGRAARAMVDDKTTTIIGGRGEAGAIEKRCRELRAAIERQRYLSYDRERLRERLARLAGGVAVLRVGGDTEAEMRHRMQTVTRALNATRAAVAGGIVPGGGVALLGCVADLAPLTASSPGESAGIEVVRRALAAPLRRNADNAGTDGAAVVARILERGDPDWGFDARRGCYTNLMRNGVIDPVRVVRAALANAASAGRLVIGTEAAIASRPSARRLPRPERMNSVGVRDRR